MVSHMIQAIVSRKPSMRHRGVAMASLLGVMVFLPILGGCHASSQRQIAIAGADQPVAAAYSVDVVNTAGGVLVMTDPTLETPVVQARLRGAGAADGHVQAMIEGSSLMVRRTSDSPASTLVDVTVWVPATSRVSVRTEQGKVSLNGVGGVVMVSVGEMTGVGGSIDLRTLTPLREGVSLTTTQGSVSAMMPALSSGRVELQTASGQVFIRSTRGELTNGQSGPGYYTGTLNDQGPEIALLTGEGDVTLEVLERPFQSASWHGR
jgi:hypothetical protein